MVGVRREVFDALFHDSVDRSGSKTSRQS